MNDAAGESGLETTNFANIIKTWQDIIFLSNLGYPNEY
jgi:hypothetical protein